VRLAYRTFALVRGLAVALGLAAFAFLADGGNIGGANGFVWVRRGRPHERDPRSLRRPRRKSASGDRSGA